MPEIELRGCRSQPLMAYLKALGVLLHVGAAEPEARLAWRRAGHAFLRSSLTEDGLVAFFVEDYTPSPITSPWNGNSGYHPRDVASKRLLERLVASEDPRLRPLRAAIIRARRLIEAMEPSDTPEQPFGDKRWKQRLLEEWRASADDSALDWLDAAMALRDDGPAMNPLLGTGGNDGRLEFSTTFHAALVECLPTAFSPGASDDRSRQLGGLALLDRGDPAVGSGPIGMFSPGAAGLPNSSSTPREGALTNPWDLVLMLEGATVFGGGVARRLASGWASFPFTIAGGTTRVGRSLSADADASSRGETWLPLWSRPASVAAVRRLLAEGRAQDDRVQARSGRTLQRAAASIGVDRGVVAFERMVHTQRFSRMYISVPAGRVEVCPNAQVEVLRAADAWLDRIRRIDVPSIRTGVARVERLEHEAVRGGSEVVEEWLLALADLQIAVGRRPASRDATSGVRPLAGLTTSVIRTLHRHAQGRPEWELARAAALAGRVLSVEDPSSRGVDEVSLRRLVEPVAPIGSHGYRWHGEHGLGRGASLRQPLALLVALAHARSLLHSPPDDFCAGLPAVLAFLRGETDDRRIVRLAHALSLCRVARIEARLQNLDSALPRVYAMTRLVVGRQPVVRANAPAADVVPDGSVVLALAAGDTGRAVRGALRRLHVDGVTPFPALVAATTANPERVAAALAFPLNAEGRQALARAVLWPAETLPTRSGALE